MSGKSSIPLLVPAIIFLYLLIPVRGLFVIGPDMSIVYLLSSIIIIIWFGRKYQEGTLRCPTDFHFVFFLLIIWIILANTWGLGGINGIYFSIQFIGYFVLSIVIWDIVRTPRMVYHLVSAFLIGTILRIIIEFSAYFYFDLHRMAYLAGPNYTVVSFILGIPVAAFFIESKKSVGTNLLYYLSIIVLTFSVVGVILNQSRQGLVALFVLIITLSFLKYNITKSIFIAFPISGFITGMAYRLYEHRLQRGRDIFEQMVAVLIGEDVEHFESPRIEIIDTARQIFIENPYLGVGPEGYRIATEIILDRSRTTHSTYLQILAEFGIVGFVIFGVLVVLLFKNALSTSGPYRVLSMGFLAAWLTISFTNDWFAGIEIWGLIFLILAASTFSNQSLDGKENRNVKRI